MTKVDIDNKENDSNKTTMTQNSPESNGSNGSKNQRRYQPRNQKNKNHRQAYPPYKNAKNFYKGKQHQHRPVTGAYAGAYPGGLWHHVYGHPMPPVGYYNGGVSPLTNHAFPHAGLPDGGLYHHHHPYGYHAGMYYQQQQQSFLPKQVNVVSPEKSTLSATAAEFVPGTLAPNDGTNTNGEPLAQQPTKDEAKDSIVVKEGKILLADVETTTDKKKKKRVRSKNNKSDPNTPKTTNKTVLAPPPGLSKITLPEALEKPALVSPPRLSSKAQGTLPPPPGLGGKVDQVASTAYLPSSILAATGPVFIEDDEEEDQLSVSGQSTNPNSKSNSPSPVTVADFPSLMKQEEPAKFAAIDDDWTKSAAHNPSAMDNNGFSSAWQTPRELFVKGRSNKTQLQCMREHVQKKQSAPWSDPAAVLAAVTQKPNGCGNQPLWSAIAASTPSSVVQESQVQTAATSAAPAMIFDEVEEHEQGGSKVEEESEQEDSPFKISPLDAIRRRHGICFVHTPGKNKF